MKDVYEDVKVFSHGQVALSLQAGCVSCIREAFQVFISLFDRLESDPDVNPDFDPEADKAPEAGSQIDTFDYDLMEEQVKNRWAEVKANINDGEIVNDEEAVAEMDRLFSEIREETPEGFAKSRGLATFEIDDFVEHLADMYIQEKPAEPVTAPLQEPAPGAEDHSKAIEADLQKHEVFPPAPFQSVDPAAEVAMAKSEPDPATTPVKVTAPEVGAEPAAVRDERPVDGLPVNTPETLSPQQRAAITKKINASKKVNAEPVQTPDKPE